MKMSVAELLSIPTLAPAASAFADATGAEYRNPAFEPGQDVAYLVACPERSGATQQANVFAKYRLTW